MSRAGRANRSGVAYDMDTGMKVKGRLLRDNPERPGILTTDPDRLNPQRYVRTPGPDGQHFRRGAPKNERHDVTTYLGVPRLGGFNDAGFGIGHNLRISHEPQLRAWAGQFAQGLGFQHEPPTQQANASVGVVATSSANVLPSLSATAALTGGVWTASASSTFGSGPFGIGAFGSGGIASGSF